MIINKHEMDKRHTFSETVNSNGRSLTGTGHSLHCHHHRPYNPEISPYQVQNLLRSVGKVLNKRKFTVFFPLRRLRLYYVSNWVLWLKDPEGILGSAQTGHIARLEFKRRLEKDAEAREAFEQHVREEAERRRALRQVKFYIYIHGVLESWCP